MSNNDKSVKNGKSVQNPAEVTIKLTLAEANSLIDLITNYGGGDDYIASAYVKLMDETSLVEGY